jgi:hypothetical protein
MAVDLRLGVFALNMAVLEDAANYPARRCVSSGVARNAQVGGRDLLRYWGCRTVRKLLSGRRRYALAFLVVGASVAVMGPQCQPTKPPLEGLRTAPAEHDFGVDPSGGGAGDSGTFVVTNDGPDATGALEVSRNLFDPDDFDITSDGCNGNNLDAGEDCTIDV